MGPLFLQPAITGELKAVWVLLVIALPLLGSLGWLFLGRPGARRQLAAVGQG
ncbi:PLDc N-terminal domain-containing protein [Kocuria palustris]|uniref:PLDc N-terminal domain-containing protein n=1 Tax=Kocuria palustris TaxID=71999 RepID=UPI0028D0E579|nr:PLDc N-terminal domain-containing protein [Kocuria palustris]